MARVALISHIAPAIQGYVAILQSLGHEPVGLLLTRGLRGPIGFGETVDATPLELDVVVPSSRERVAPLLRALEPDLVLCAGFPWKLRAEDLAVPPLGVINFHPSLLPKYRGPTPISWAIRNGEHEFGVTYHRMEPELDTGAILAQEAIPIGDMHTFEELGEKIRPVTARLLPIAIDRAIAGDPGDSQDESQASYQSLFEPEYAEIDWSRPAAEIARQVQAWRFTFAHDGDKGAMTELDGERIRVLRVSLEPADGRAVECGDGTVWIVESEPA